MSCGNVCHTNSSLLCRPIRDAKEHTHVSCREGKKRMLLLKSRFKLLSKKKFHKTRSDLHPSAALKFSFTTWFLHTTTPPLGGKKKKEEEKKRRKLFSSSCFFFLSICLIKGELRVRITLHRTSCYPSDPAVRITQRRKKLIINANRREEREKREREERDKGERR